MTRLGIYRESGYEHLDGCVVVPIIGPDGQVTEMYGRKMDPRAKGHHLYLAGPHVGVWNPEALESRELILCEALIDALTFWVHGFRNVTTAYGVEGFAKELEYALAAARVRRVLIAFDRDEAGDRGAEKVAARLKAHGIESDRVRFPKGMDANAYALKVKPADESLALALKSAVPLWRDENRKKEPLPPLAAPETAEPVPAAESTAPIFKEPEPTAAPTPAPAPLVTAAGADVPMELKGEDVLIHLGDREYRIRGLVKNLAYDVLKVNLRARKPPGIPCGHARSLSGESESGVHRDGFGRARPRARGDQSRSRQSAPETRGAAG